MDSDRRYHLTLLKLKTPKNSQVKFTVIGWNEAKVIGMEQDKHKIMDQRS